MTLKTKLKNFWKMVSKTEIIYQNQSIDKLVEDENLINNMAKLEQKIKTNQELKDIIEKMNKMTNRDIKVQYRNWYGEHIRNIILIAYGMKYNNQLAHEMVNKYSWIDMDVMEMLVKSIGRPAFYSKNHKEIIEEIKPDIDSLHQILDIIKFKSKLDIDTSKLTKENMDDEFSYYRQKANKVMEEYTA